ncbi:MULTISPECIES: hypothetical protein [Clostridiaceae]|uniref:Uncharacterized protein n=1 Tax=Clostridium facile TaxID=2763035 RepID=A0ABR7IQH5_9CLOT|nr:MULTISPECIES: hypothetical protein [Clostridiaceae]MBC5787386.1 hypothetical protein [Clostridium facile]
MKKFLQFVMGVAVVLASIRLVQMLIEYAYEHLGKRYVTSEELNQK